MDNDQKLYDEITNQHKDYTGQWKIIKPEDKLQFIPWSSREVDGPTITTLNQTRNSSIKRTETHTFYPMNFDIKEKPKRWNSIKNNYLKCATCGYSSNRKDNFKRHKKAGCKFTCSYCDQEFKTKSALKRHNDKMVCQLREER